MRKRKHHYTTKMGVDFLREKAQRLWRRRSNQGGGTPNRNDVIAVLKVDGQIAATQYYDVDPR
jgi:hypothetical protein